jgi:hypothetical protein
MRHSSSSASSSLFSPSLMKKKNLKGTVSRDGFLAFDNMFRSNKGRGLFLNFLGAPMIL